MPRIGGRPSHGLDNRAGIEGGRTVHVRGYIREDGTWVPGHTRSARRTAAELRMSNYASGTPGGEAVHVSGYTRTNVPEYTRVARQANAITSDSTSSNSASNSTGSGDVIYISGYTRANGTYVHGHTRGVRQTTSDSNSSKATTCGNTIYVHGFTRSDGTQVRGYTKSVRRVYSTSKPLSNTNGLSSANGTVCIRGYARLDGKYVKGHIRSLRSRQSAGEGHTVELKHNGIQVPGRTRLRRGYHLRSIYSSTKSGHAIQVGPYMRSDGTHISGYTKWVPESRSAKYSVANQTTTNATCSVKYYVDNAYNRKLNRVGLPVRTRIVSKASTSVVTTEDEPQRCYVDNYLNRRLGRVGQLMPLRTAKIQEALEKKTLEELRLLMRNLHFTDPAYEDQQYALHMLEHQALEEKWKAMNVKPSTDLSRLSQYVRGKIIALGELQLEKRIGCGKFGEVYAGLWHGTPIAFKKLHYQKMSRRRLASFATEITVLAALDHPNTIWMFGAVVEDGTIGIVMEYMHRSLFHAIFVTEESFSEGKKKAIVGQVSCAVDYLHSHDPKIAHCDIKSENVLLDINDNAKLTDFGLSTMKNSPESSQCDIAIGKGTPCYSAPEVLRGELLSADQLFPVDIYSLSIVVYEVVVEEEAFSGLSVKQLEANVGHGNLRPPLYATVSQQVVDLLNRSWNSDPSRRPTSFEFRSAWSSLSEIYNNS